MKVKLRNGKTEELEVITDVDFKKLMELPKEDLIFLIDCEIVQSRLSKKIAQLMYLEDW